MARHIVFICIIVLLTFSSFGQSVQDLFKVLPNDLTPYLTETIKETLIEYGTYTSVESDSSDIEKCDYSLDNNHIRLEFSYPYGPSGFSVVELKKFERTDGSILLVYSKYGGGPRLYDQHDLKVFDFNQNHLVESETTKLPKSVDLNEYLKPETPDTVRQDFGNYLSTYYDLNPEEVNGVKYSIFLGAQKYEEWVQTLEIVFTWDGTTFMKSKKKK